MRKPGYALCVWRAWKVIRFAAIGPGGGVARVELECLIEICNGGGKIALVTSRRIDKTGVSGLPRTYACLRMSRFLQTMSLAHSAADDTLSAAAMSSDNAWDFHGKF